MPSARSTPTVTNRVTSTPTVRHRVTSTPRVIVPSGVPTVSAVLAAPLGSLTATATATVTHPATLAAPLGALTASASATVKHSATLAAPLGSLTAAATATVTPGEFSPDQLSGLIAWIDASDTATITHVGGAVSAIASKAGSAGAISLTAAGGVQPTTGIRTQNSLNVLDFDGDFLSADISDQAQPVTIYVFGASDSTNTSNRQAIGTGTNQPAIYKASGPTYRIYAGTELSSGLTVTADFRFMAGRFDNTSSKVWIDATTATGTTGTGSLTHLYLGAASTPANFWDGTIGEAIWCAGSHDDATVAQVRAYCQDKWATA